MGQYHAVVNLDKQAAIEPHSMGEFTKLMEFGHGGATVASLIYLLAEGWSGEHIAIIGDYAKDDDLTAAQTDILGVPASQVHQIMDTKGDNRIRRQSWMARGVLESKGLVSFEKDGSRYKQTWLDDAELEVAPADDRPDVVVVNLDRSEYLDPHAFGDSGSLNRLAVDGGYGGTQTALVVLLAASCKGGSRGGGDIRESASDNGEYVELVGSWAGDRIAVLDRDALADGAKNVSAKVRDLLAASGEGKYATTEDDGRIVRDPEFYA